MTDTYLYLFISLYIYLSPRILKNNFLILIDLVGISRYDVEY